MNPWVIAGVLGAAGLTAFGIYEITKGTTGGMVTLTCTPNGGSVLVPAGGTVQVVAGPLPSGEQYSTAAPSITQTSSGTSQAGLTPISVASGTPVNGGVYGTYSNSGAGMSTFTFNIDNSTGQGDTQTVTGTVQTS
jgi:hypothetical protein